MLKLAHKDTWWALMKEFLIIFYKKINLMSKSRKMILENHIEIIINFQNINLN